jgi:hypothetical protein
LKLFISQPNFVREVILSSNQLTSQVIGLIKREKLRSQYLKNVVVHGIKIDAAVAKKEGISQGEMASGRVKVGDMTLVL